MRRHTVILGAGATIATIPNGDKNSQCTRNTGNFLNLIKLSTENPTAKHHA